MPVNPSSLSPKFFKPEELKYKSKGKKNIFVITSIVVFTLVAMFFAIWGISIAVKTYSYAIVEVDRDAPYSIAYPVERDYRAAYTEYYYVTDSKGQLKRKSRYHSAQYYFKYNGHKYSVAKSTYDGPTKEAIVTYQVITYRREPNYPGYPNKVDTTPYRETHTVGSVIYR